MIARGLWVALLLLSASAVEAAVEQRCTDLGAACKCSEPLNTNSFPVQNTSWQNPADTTGSDKQCSMVGDQEGWAFESNETTIFGANSGVAWDALPAGAKTRISWIARKPDGHGTILLGHRGPGAPTTGNGSKVRALRAYVFWSTNYQYTNEGSCTNSKLFQSEGPGGTVYIKHIGGGGFFNDGHFPYWSPSQDCCGAPWPDGISAQILKGKWWRVEAHVINPAGGTNNAARFRIFLKDLATGTEYTITDTGVAGAGFVTSPNMTPGSPGAVGSSYFNNMHIHLFRAGSCGGHNAMTHVLYAGWDTDTGQRIGAASEIEGAAGPTLNAPTNLRGCTGVGCVPSSMTGPGVLLAALLVWRVWRRR